MSGLNAVRFLYVYGEWRRHKKNAGYCRFLLRNFSEKDFFVRVENFAVQE